MNRFFKGRELHKEIILGISLLGIILSGYLWLYDFNETYMICKLSNCAEVLSSEWAHFYGIPIAALGFIFYSLLFFLTWQRMHDDRRWLKVLVRIVSIFGLVFSLYLRYIDIIILKDWCIWCWVSFIFVIMINILIFLENKIQPRIQHETDKNNLRVS